MKLTIEDVQVAIKGMMKHSNQCISDQLLAVHLRAGYDQQRD
ncbi:hypothetical protein [Salmonella enterica]